MRLTALRRLIGDYGSIREGQTFEVDEETALYLESRGFVERYREPPAVVPFLPRPAEPSRPLAKAPRRRS